MEERSGDATQLQEGEVTSEKEDLLEAAIQYASAKHAGYEDAYPPDASKVKKRAIRKRAESISVQNGKLFYTDRRKLIVEVVTADEQKHILWACHADITFGHFGVKKTAGRIAERFYWRGMYKQVEDVVSLHLDQQACTCTMHACTLDTDVQDQKTTCLRYT